MTEEFSDKHVRRMQYRRLLELVRDPAQVPVEKWTIPEDTHLLKSPAAFRDQVVEQFGDDSCKGDPMPASKTNQLLRFRAAETSMWVGYHESYKTTFLSELSASWACRRIPVAIASLEMPAPVLLRKAVQQTLASDRPAVDMIDVAIERLAESMIVYDVVGRIAPRHLVAIMRYCAIELGVRHFVIDNLTLVLSVDNDRAGEHQQFVAACSTVARTTGLHVHLLAHTSKPERGDESKIPTGYDARGTGSAVDMVDNVLICHRNKKKEDRLADGASDRELFEEPDFLLKVDKQRHFPFRGAFKYWLDARTLRFKEYGTSDVEPFI